ncbi:MAG: GtrA family protein [Fibromonadales bacterium]|nr:GtrA family protein [Fibromonadales bacterium]
MGIIKDLLPKFIQYFFVGLFCAIVNWCVFYIFNYKLNIPYLPAAVASFLISATVNFFLCKIVFKSKEGRKKITEYVMVVLVGAIGLSIDLGVMALCIEFFGFPNMFAKITGTGVAFIFNYTSKQFYIFSPK